jgi:hypothetical protein
MPPTPPEDARCWMLDPPSRPRSERRGKGALNGGAWHPDSQRIGVPGILSGRATTEGCLESRSAAPESGHGDGDGHGHGEWR